MNKFCHNHPQLCLDQQKYEYLKQFNNGRIAHPGIQRHSGVQAHPGVKKKINPGALATKVLINTLKTQRVGKVSSEFPKKLENLVRGISDRPVKGFETIFEGKQFNMSLNPKTKEMRINFKGASPGEPNVPRIIKNQKIYGPDVTEEREFLKALGLKNGKAEFEGVDYNVTLVGHSYGGYKARLYGAETNTPAEVFNGHIMPWSTFPKTESPVNYHTIITDPVDFKFLERLDSNVTHTYYQPLTPDSTELSRKIVGSPSEGPSFMDPHYAIAWEDLDRETQSSIVEAIKTKYPEIGIAAIALAPSIYAAATDPNYNPQTDPLLGGVTELGPLGINLDPNYQWSDIAPPTGGLDWIIWKTLNPLAKAIASPTNPVQAETTAKDIETVGNLKDLSKVQTFTYNGEEYYYRPDITGAPIWYSINGAPLSQDIKNAFEQSKTVKPSEEIPIDFTEIPF